jgi:anti-anti-sigma regulatory factor
LNRRVREVLELTRLANVMAIYANEEAAMLALQEGQKFSAPQAG